MPIHDWSRVGAGTFHHFHSAWITHLTDALNDGRLPPDYYAMAEQIAAGFGPDVLTLKEAGPPGAREPEEPQGAVAVAVAPPKVRITAMAEMDQYTVRQRRVVVRHASDDRVIAMIEILSPGNKTSRHAMRSFVDKAVGALTRGLHLLLIDLHPPGPRDPRGIHGAVWEEFSSEPYSPPEDKPLTMVAYSAGLVKTAYVEPVAVGDSLPEMPVFLTPDDYIPLGLEATYLAAWRGVPRRWRDVLDPPATRGQDAGAS